MTKRLKEAREVLPVTIPSIEGVEGPEREKKVGLIIHVPSSYSFTW